MSTRRGIFVAGACVTLATGVYYAIKWISRKVKDLKHPLVQIGTVAELYVHPVKSCRARKVNVMECLGIGGKKGELRDRHFCVYRKSTCKYMTMKQCPRLVIIDGDVRNGMLTLTTPEHEPIQVDIHKVLAANQIVNVKMYGDLKNEGLDCGQEVGSWLEKVLHEDDQLGLLHYKDGLYSERWSHRGYRWFFGIAPIKDKIAFPYLAPYLCVSSASIEDVKSRLPDDKEISARNFRANIVIDGCALFDEDWWMELKIGEVVFECYESCDRCVITTIDPSTGYKDPDMQPLKVLQQYRLAPEGKLRERCGQCPLFGVYLGVDHCGTIHVGDKVFARYKSHPF